MALQRYWYIDRGQGGRDRLGIVEKANSQTTKETITTDWASVSEAKDLRIYTIDTQEDFVAGDLTVEKTDIPKRYHEALVNRVISLGYRDARNMKFDAAQFFDGEYEKLIKKAKKQARSNYQTHGFVKQIDF
tara:strand:- start:1581 stop:1976 length:396 start_codon:yes stop_codon:yes gene_type:complete